MQNYIKFGFKNRLGKYLIYSIIVLLVFPALLINLGLMPFLEDEAIRALVALEMLLSDDYITPTLGGIPYFNKPPFYNWIILLIYKITNGYSEFIIRMPSIIFLIIYALSIYHFTKRYLGKKFAFINALAFMTCGRILFYDSMLGLIDITYSWVTYLMFNFIFIYYTKQKYFLLFTITYLFTAMGFMFKGLPSIVFTGISLLAVFISNRNFKKLFSIYHFLGIFLFLVLLTTYYLIYNKINPGLLKNVFSVLYKESSMRTVIEHRLVEGIFHFFKFPFEFLFHFLPWTFLIILLFRKENITKIWQEPYLKFCVLILTSNLIVYWFSPNVFPRYFFMLIPLLYTILFYLFSVSQDIKLKKIIEMTFLSGMVLLTLFQVIIPFHKRTSDVPYGLIITIISVISYSIIILLFITKKEKRFLLFIVFMLILRIEFDFVIINIREKEAYDSTCRLKAIEVGKELKNETLLMDDRANIFPTINTKLLNYMSMFYITRERMEILDRGNINRTDAYFITYDEFLKDKKYIKYYDLPIRHEKRTSRVVKIFTE